MESIAEGWRVSTPCLICAKWARGAVELTLRISSVPSHCSTPQCITCIHISESMTHACLSETGMLKP